MIRRPPRSTLFPYHDALPISDQALTFLREVDNINMRRRIRMVDLAREVCDGSLLGKRVAVLGAAFKPNSDDIRDSPALNVAAQDRKSTRLNSSHANISYAVFC